MSMVMITVNTKLSLHSGERGDGSPVSFGNGRTVPMFPVDKK